MATNKKIPLTAVVAVTPSYGIGNLGGLPWGHTLPGDLAYFRKMTKGTKDPAKQNACLMGRRTWLGIPEKNRPLRGRINIVLTGDRQWAKDHLPPHVHVASSLDDALTLINQDPALHAIVETAVVVGGVQLFEEVLLHPWCDTYHVTQLDKEFDADTVLTQKTADTLAALTPVSVSEEHNEGGVTYRMKVYSPNGEVVAAAASDVK